MMKVVKIVGALACLGGTGLAFGGSGSLVAVGAGMGITGFILFIVGRMGDG